MSMTAVNNQLEVAAAAYRLTTDGTITEPFPWQADLYHLLSQPDRDAADLLLTPTGAGKTEAIVIPALGLHRGGAARRLFHIAPEGATLDDLLYRLIPYLRAWVMADETPRTLCVDVAPDGNGGDGSQCRRFYPDGSEDPHIVTNPLEADVDVILTTLSRFRSLFFGAGGVHALPSALSMEDTGQSLRRDLFYFDEAHGYQPDVFARFHRLVEFLYAEDADVIVGSTTMPVAFQEELSCLEPIQAPLDAARGVCLLTHISAPDPTIEIELQVRRAYYQNSRVIVACDTPADAEAFFARLASSYPHSVVLYHTGQPNTERRRIYAQLRELEKEGEGYLLLTDGDALERADLDATLVLSPPCPPENLIRRAGRCNRRGDLTEGHVIVVGDQISPIYRLFPQSDRYLAALRGLTDSPFETDAWKAFI
jgi:CRISPR-associated endonuclease/helicase Cas3